jgi:ribosome-associated translation inhibitor RaiA
LNAVGNVPRKIKEDPMNSSTAHSPLRVEFRFQNCSVTPERREFLETHLGLIPQLIAQFPVADLHVDVHKHPQKEDFHIKMSLRLNSETLFTGDRNAEMMPAYNHCVTKMVAKIKDFKEKLSRKHRWEKDTAVSQDS